MKCPACQTENPADSQYCNKCGSSIDLSTSPTLSYSGAQETALSESLKFNPGEKFGDRYTIIEEIGQGGMGRVYKARDHELGITVVLKMIRPELTSRPGMIDQFRKETLLGRSVSHENVVRIHDLGEVNKIRYISMDFIKGENLAELMKTSGSLALSTCLQIALQVCRALKAAHEKGIVHQDLKPQNIMIDNSGKVYVTDFGLAKSASAAPAHRLGKVSGTPKYFSPEQARGEESDLRSDIYSLGVILYEMVAGSPPFKADSVEGYIKKHASERPPSPSKFNADVPPACEKIILKCLEKKKEDRYKSIDELIRDLEAQKAHVRGLGAMGRWGRWQKALVVSAAIAIAGFGGYEIIKPIIWPPPPPPSSGRVAVMYAVNNSGDKSLDDRLRWVIPYYLAMALTQSKYLSVLPQDRLMQILSDMKQVNEERPLSRTLDRVSDEANVGYFVLPSFTKAGADIAVSFTVRRAKSDQTVGESGTVRGKGLEDIPSMAEEMSQKVKSQLNLSAAEIAGDANQRLDKITTVSPEAVRYFVESQKAYAEGDFRSSVQALKEAVIADPNYALAYKQMAIDYGYLGELENSRKMLQKALDLSDRVSERDRYFIQAYAVTMLNDSPLPAIEIYKKIISLYPADEEAYSSLGSTYRNLEEWDLAINQYEKVAALNPKYPFLTANKAIIYAAKGRYKEALGLAEGGVAGSINVNYFLRQLPLLYLIQGQYEGAATELRRSLERRPDSPGLLELGGILDLLKGDFGRAGQVFEDLRRKGEAIPEAPSLDGRRQLVGMHVLHGQYRQAQREISEGIEMARRSDLAWDEMDYRWSLAYTEFQLKRYSRATEASKAALEIARRTFESENQRSALHLLGLASVGQGRVQEAVAIANQLHQLIERTAFPRSMRRYEHLMGQVALKEGHPDEAVRHFEQAVSLLPCQTEIYDEQAFYYDGLASARYQSGDWPRAIETYKSIISMTTGRLRWGDIYARSYYWLGKCYQRSGNGNEARANYLKFLELWKNADEGLPEVTDAQKQLEALRKAP